MAEHFAHLSCGAVTDVGSRRKNNEDSIVTLPSHGVFCVADGMGGVQGGEVASQAAVTFLSKAFGKLDGPEGAESIVAKSQIIDRALNSASSWIKQRSDKKGTKGSGTTAVVIAFDARNPGHGMVLHAGDSRAYRLRDGILKQLSQDHTVAAAAGLEDDADLPAMFRGVVTRAVGVKARVEVEKTPVEVRAGDVYLLSSDGLDKMVTDPEIQERMTAYAGGDLQALAQTLVDDANRNGGVDNVSVIAVRVGETDAEAVTVSREVVQQEVKTYLAEDERLREMGVVGDVDDGERVTGEGDTSRSGSIVGVSPGGDEEDESDTEDRLIQPAGPLATWWRKWLRIPIGLRYALFLAVLAFIALIVMQILRGRGGSESSPATRPPASPTGEAERAIETQPATPRGPRTVPVLMPEPEPEPEPEMTPEERQAQVDRMLQNLDALGPDEDPPPDQGVAPEEPAEDAEPEPVDPAEQARRAREEREARSPARQAEVRAAMPGKIDAALASGEWGALGEHVEYWEQYIDGLVNRTGKALVYRGWLEAWETARDAADGIPTMLAAYEDGMLELYAACGFDPPERTDLGSVASADDLASRYCASRHAWQTDFARKVRGMALRHDAQSRLLPDDPSRALRNLWLFSGQTDTAGAEETARGLARGREALDGLRTWMAVRTSEPFSAEELGLVPLDSVPLLRESFNLAWDNLYESVVRIAPQLSAWRSWADETLAEQLDALAKLQEEVVASRVPYGEDVAAWRASASHEALSRLLVQVDKVYPLLRRKIDAAKR